MQAPEVVTQARQYSPGDVVGALVPSNYIGALAAGRFFPVILVSLFLAAVLATMRQRRRTVLQFFEGMYEAVVKLVSWVMYGLPVGLFCMAAVVMAQQTDPLHTRFDDMLTFIIALAVGLVVHALIILPLMARLYGVRSIASLAGKTIPALGTALTTGSSVTALPVTQRCVVDSARIDHRAAAAVLPLGSTMNLNGTAMYVIMVGFFALQSGNVQVGWLQVVALIIGAWLAAIASGGIPGAALLLTVVVFDIAGFPEGAFASLALIAAIDWLAARGATVVDVWSDALGAAVVAERMPSMSRRVSRPERSRRQDDRRRDRRSSGRGHDRQSSSRDRQSSSRDRSARGPSRTDRDQRSRRDSRRSEQRRPHPRSDRNRDSRPPQRESAPPAKEENRSPFELEAQPTVELDGVTMTTDQQTPSGKQTEQTDNRPPRSSEADNEGRSERQSRSSRPQEHRRPPDRERPQRRSRTSSDRSAAPSVDQLEREKARVQAQLASLGDSKSKTDQSADTHKSSTADGAGHSRSVSEPQIDYAVEDLNDAVRTKPDDDTHTESDTAPDEKRQEATDDSSHDEFQYGGRNRMHRPDKSEDETDVDESDMPEAVDAYSAEDQNFGRAKKKRERR
jgi:Na+/H+-dicarboxylate symporter